jgi:hypothetical protein
MLFLCGAHTRRESGEPTGFICLLTSGLVPRKMQRGEFLNLKLILNFGISETFRAFPNRKKNRFCSDFSAILRVFPSVEESILFV